MNSVVLVRVTRYLQERLGCRPFDCGAILSNMRTVARMAGHDLDERFAEAGLGAGPEAAAASAIVKRALEMGGGGPATEQIVKQTVRQWVRVTRPLGR